MFKKAVKYQSKLRLAIAGPSGSGKTFTALEMATAMADRVALVDTEHGSASKYADIFAFDVFELQAPYHPNDYIEAIKAAVQAKYEVLILDTLSHAWSGTGGVLEIVDKVKLKYSGNTYAAWLEGTPLQNALIEAMLSADLHPIATMRSKQDYILVAGKDGKSTPKKIGMAPIQRDGVEYEFDVFLEMDLDNNVAMTKTRCSLLAGEVIHQPGSELTTTLLGWLDGRERDWKKEVLQATSPAGFARAAYQLSGAQIAFENARRIQDWYGFACGDFSPTANERALATLNKYIAAVADGATVKEAAVASRKIFQNGNDEEVKE